MNQTFQNSAQVLSVGIFFFLMIVGLSATLPHTLSRRPHGQRRHRRRPPCVREPVAAGLDPARRVPRLDPSGLHVDPCVLGALPAHHQAVLTGQTFFPTLISEPFRDGLHAAFAFAMVACLVAAGASAMRGGRTPAAVLVPKQHAA